MIRYCAQAIKQHPSALQLYRERLQKEGTVSKDQVRRLLHRYTCALGGSSSGHEVFLSKRFECGWNTFPAANFGP